jgi:hypothetical protein
VPAFISTSLNRPEHQKVLSDEAFSAIHFQQEVHIVGREQESEIGLASVD